MGDEINERVACKGRGEAMLSFDWAGLVQILQPRKNRGFTWIICDDCFWRQRFIASREILAQIPMLTPWHPDHSVTNRPDSGSQILFGRIRAMIHLYCKVIRNCLALLLPTLFLA